MFSVYYQKRKIRFIHPRIKAAIHFDLVICYKIVFNLIKVRFDYLSLLFLLWQLVVIGYLPT